MRTAAIQFTPAKSGIITLKLIGPWQEAAKGVTYKQEIFWDDVQVAGTSLDHGGFQGPGATGAGGTWQGAGTVTEQTDDLPAAEGTHYARSWHNEAIFTTLQVTGGQPVTIRLSARAVRPEGFVEMKRIAGRATPAHNAAKRYLRGANLGNGLEVPPGQDWGAHYTPEDVKLIRAEGFDHVRIPAGWHHYTGAAPDFTIQPAFFVRVDELVNAGLKQGLGLIINIHHFDDFTSDPKGQTAKFLAIWSQIAEHYAKAAEGLALELLNEPKDAATTEIINPIFAEAIARIRKVDKDRTIFLGPGRWNSVDELNHLRLPDDDQNLIVSVHSYEPFLFTHQGATWSGPDTKVTGIKFPGPPVTRLVVDPSLQPSQWVFNWIERYNTEPAASNPCSKAAVQVPIDKAKEWSEYYGRPIHFGEFGCFTTADAASCANFYRAFREAAEKAGIGWALWDWKAAFRYWDEKSGKPEPGMREALFGNTRG